MKVGRTEGGESDSPGERVEHQQIRHIDQSSWLGVQPTKEETGWATERRMVEGTWMKQLESRLDMLELSLRHNHEQVDERLETVEAGIRHTQEEVGHIQADVSMMEMNIQEEFSGLSQ